MRDFPSPLQWWRLSLSKGFSSAPSLAATAFLVALVTTCLWIPISLVGNAVSAQQSGQDSQLNVVLAEIPADSADQGITTRTLDKLRGIDGVQAVAINLTASIAGETEPWSANVNVIRPWLLPPGIDNANLGDDEIILPASIDGVDFTPLVGKKITFSYVRGISDSMGEDATASVTVKGVYPANWTGYGPRAALASQNFVLRIHAARYASTPQEVMDTSGVPGAWIQAKDSASASSVAEAVQRLGLDATSMRDQLNALPGVLSSFPTLLAIFASGLAFVLIAHIYQALKNNFKARISEFGLLRVRGLSSRSIRLLVVGETLVGVGAGAVVGAGIGLASGWWLARTLSPPELLQALTPSLLWGAVAQVAVVVGAVALLGLITAAIMTETMLKKDPFLLVLRD